MKAATTHLKNSGALFSERVVEYREQVLVEQQLSARLSNAAAQIDRQEQRTRDDAPERHLNALLLVREPEVTDYQLVRIVEITYNYCI